MIERATDGQRLYEATGRYVAEIEGYDFKDTPPWEAIGWELQDEWEAQADELNEARRYADER